MMGIHDSDDSIQSNPLGKKIIYEKGLSYRPWIREPSRLDENGIEAVPSFHQVAKNPNQIAPDRATYAAIVHLEDFFIGIDDQGVVNANLAELILDNGYSLAMLFTENAI
jgi:hypothetical protein